MSIRKRFLVSFVLCGFALCEVAAAQYTPGMPAPGGTTPVPSGTTPVYKPRSYSVNKAMIGAGAGAAVAGGVLFYALRHRGMYHGCVGPDGNTLTRDKDGKQFHLEGQTLQPGEKVSIKAKKDANDSDGGTLEVEKVRKDYGPCEQKQASAAAAQHP